MYSSMMHCVVTQSLESCVASTQRIRMCAGEIVFCLSARVPMTRRNRVLMWQSCYRAPHKGSGLKGLLYPMADVLSCVSCTRELVSYAGDSVVRSGQSWNPWAPFPHLRHPAELGSSKIRLLHYNSGVAGHLHDSFMSNLQRS